jgi:phosphate transport system permease protein
MTDLFTTVKTNDALRAEIQEISKRGRNARLIRSRIVIALCMVALAIAVVPLAALSWEIIAKGLPVLKASFFTQLPLTPNLANPNMTGGVSNAIIGSLVLVLYSSILSVPIGVLTGIYTAENENRIASLIRLMAQTMAGAPSILMGLFAFALICQQLGFGYSALAGAFALAVLMVPVIVVATEIAVRNVPQTLREAGLALGAKPHKVSMRIVLPTALSGIVTGCILAISRAVGEAAPVLFTIGGASLLNWKPTDPVSALPISIFIDAKSQWPSLRAMVFGIALVLLFVVFIASFTARLLVGRQQRKS